MTRAALIVELGGSAVPGEVDDASPVQGGSIVEMEAAALNPVDLAIATGDFYAGHPPLPYVPGIEAVGRVGKRRVYVSGAGQGVSRNGLIRESFASPDETFIEIPEEIDAGTAVALGTAGLAGWLPITWRAKVEPGETVLVLGATGFAGGIAVQAARHLKAGKIIASGRNGDRLSSLEGQVDATVQIGRPDFRERLVQACGENGANVIFDCLWGPPTEEALHAASVDARLVQLGASAGAVARLPSGMVRGKRLNILGYSNFGVPGDVREKAYLEMLDLTLAGQLEVSVEAIELGRVSDAWAGLQEGGQKYVVVP